MKCPKCKTEIEKGCKFCDQCGYSFKKRKRNKIIILTIVLAIVGFGLGSLGSYYLSPTYIATKYFKTVISNDASAIYKYVDSKSPFIDKELFIEKYEPIGKVKNYEIGEIGKENDYVLVDFSFELDGDNTNSYVKLEEKKFLGLITYYKVVSGTVARNVKFKALKGSKVTIDNKDISKYFKTTEDEFDVYLLPDMLNADYSVKVEMPNDLVIDKKVIFNDSDTYVASAVKLNKKQKEEFSYKVIDDLNNLYSAAIENKRYSEIKDLFYNDLSNLYRNIKMDLSSDITEFKFYDVSINSVNILENGKLAIELCADYDVTAYGEVKSDYLSFKATFTYDKSIFNLEALDVIYQSKIEDYE